MKNKITRLTRFISTGIAFLLCVTCCGAAPVANLSEFSAAMPEVSATTSAFSVITPACPVTTPTAGDTATGDSRVFILRNAITWDTTPQQLKTIMGEENLTQLAEDHYDAYTKKNVSVSNYTAEMGFIYCGDQLVFTGYHFLMNSIIDEGFQYLQEAMNIKYGKPTVFDVRRMLDIFYLLDEDTTVQESDITRFCGWTLSDGTLITMCAIEGNCTEIFYFDEPKINDLKDYGYNIDGL